MTIKTGYSFRNAIGHLPEVVSRVKEIGWSVFPVTDRVSTFSYVRSSKLCKQEELRLIYGVELGVSPEPTSKKPIIDYWKFYAIDDLRPLNDLIYTATNNHGKEPLLNYSQALDASGVIKVTGPATLLDKVYDPEQDYLYFGLSPASPRGLIKASIAKGLKQFALQSNVYPRPEDAELYRVILGRMASTQTYPQHILTDDEWFDSLGYVSEEIRKEAIQNRLSVFDGCCAKLKVAKLLTPEKPHTLRKMCDIGAGRLNVDLLDPVYDERLNRELRLISEKDFEDYFYIIADMMQWARTKMIVGPARGSSCGSLVCYLLGITAVDPIKFGLIFERFIDTTRADLPDIDLDFSDVNRHLVFDYVDEKYGKEKSARLGSVSMIKVKAALNISGTNLKIPSSRINEISNTVIKRSFGDNRASSTIEDTFIDTDVGQKFIRDYPEAMITAKMEGHPNNAAQHAAGVVLTNEPVINFVAIDARTLGTMCDKKDAEELNLLKIDMLGLTQLSIFERTLELIEEEPRSEFLEALPLDDQKAFNVLNDLRFSGIFQFTPGTASVGLIEEVVLVQKGRITDIEDLISLTALVRPGPLASGAAMSWIKRRTGNEPIVYPHSSMEPFLSKTMGIVVYQEQVMEIGREIGGLSWDDVTALRKAMSRSLGKEYFDQFGDRWKSGAKSRTGISGIVADRLWDDLCNFGAWAFNRSHSVAYGIISYWCCWLKAYHPLEFAAATLDAQDDPNQQVITLRELDREGVNYLPVDSERSTDKWTPAKINEKNVLVGPLTNIKGIGPQAVIQIIEAREGKRELTPSIKKKLAEAKTPIDSLSPISDAISRVDLNGIVSKPTAIKDIKLGSDQTVVMGRISGISPVNENALARIAKRNGRVFTGPTDAVNIWIQDDTGEMFCKIGRYDFNRIGRKLLETARPGHSLYAIKGRVPPDFRMISIKDIRYLGEDE